MTTAAEDKVRVAILYQSTQAPWKGGVVKPMKPGGYADSGADIAYALLQKGIVVVTPSYSPNTHIDLDWVFPDNEAGIENALARGANVLWLNTVLFAGHPVEKAIQQGVYVVGQVPESVDQYDDKILTNKLLKRNGLPVPDFFLVTDENRNIDANPFTFPVVVKPIRGRGSQGVKRVSDAIELTRYFDNFFTGRQYGNALYIEAFLSGKEITITVMPPGKYVIAGQELDYSQYWSLPPIERFNHEDGVAPYNGTVAVINNSAVVDDRDLNGEGIQTICRQCAHAAALVGAKAPIRIDCRADAGGKYMLFDVNMKPNMTGASRPHRADQDSLTALAARRIGWAFSDLLLNMLRQRWTLS